MKKTKTPRSMISKQAYQIVKSATTTPLVDNSRSKVSDTVSNHSAGSSSYNNNTQQMGVETRGAGSGAFADGASSDVDASTRYSEEEIMGETGRVKKSDAMEKNLNQMVSVLHMRLTSLEEAAKTRLRLCEEDLMPNSLKMSKQAPKIFDEFDEAIPRSLKDTKINTSAMHSKDNLVSSDTVYIDPYHLVVKTKMPTETARKLEQNLEESFGTLNLKEMKSKKSKAQSEKSKKTEQLKNEAKKQNRLKLEKELQGNMETFVARSVMDPELVFLAPARVNEDAKWPIPMKWCSRDPRSARPENNEGEFDPDLLLQYALERMNLPSGKRVFSWLIRQPMVQRHFLTLFWIIKVKFFDHNSAPENETYLLRLMAIEYRRIMELLAHRAHAEHEKDFVYKFYPFVLTNAVYFAFFYLCPGSRHIYTKGFKKTIYMQIIQIIHGIQLCVSSVRVSWAKMFPEDNHDDPDAGGDGEEAGEMFPVQLALNNDKLNHRKSSLMVNNNNNNINSLGHGETETAGTIAQMQPFQQNLAGLVVGMEGAATQNPDGVLMLDANGNPLSPITPVDAASAGILAAMQAAREQVGPGVYPVPSHSADNGADVSAVNGDATKPGGVQGQARPGFLAVGGEEGGDFNGTALGPGPDPGPGAGVLVRAGAGFSGMQLASHQSVLPPISTTGEAGMGDAISRTQSAAGSLNAMGMTNPLGTNSGLLGTNSGILGENSGSSGAEADNNYMLSRTFSLPDSLGSSPLSTSRTDGNSTSSLSPSVVLLKKAEKLAKKNGRPPRRDGHSHHKHHRSKKGSFFPGATKQGYLRGQNKITVDDFAHQENAVDPLLRTKLTKPLEKPRDNFVVKHQNNLEPLSGQSISPQIELYLASMDGKKALPMAAQTFHRKIPVSWCPAGGMDTHKKLHINTDLQKEIAEKLAKSKAEFRQISGSFHAKKMRSMSQLEANLSKVLASGQTSIGRYSLDIRRQRNNARNNNNSSSSNNNNSNSNTGGGSNSNSNNNSSSSKNNNNNNSIGGGGVGSAGTGKGGSGSGVIGVQSGGGGAMDGVQHIEVELTLAETMVLAQYDDSEVDRFIADL